MTTATERKSFSGETPTLWTPDARRSVGENRTNHGNRLSYNTKLWWRVEENSALPRYQETDDTPTHNPSGSFNKTNNGADLSRRTVLSRKARAAQWFNSSHQAPQEASIEEGPPSTLKKAADFILGGALAGAALYGIKKTSEALMKRAFAMVPPQTDWTALNMAVEAAPGVARSVADTVVEQTRPGQAYWQSAGEFTILGVDARILFISGCVFIGLSAALLHRYCSK